MGQARPRHLAGAIGDARRRWAGEIDEQAVEVGVGPRRVDGVQALVELLRRQPPGCRVRAELARDLLALGVGGSDGSLGLVHRPNARGRPLALAALHALTASPREGSPRRARAGRPGAKRAGLVSQDDT